MKVVQKHTGVEIFTPNPFL